MEEEGEQREVKVSSGLPPYQKILMDGDEEMSVRQQPRPPPGGRSPLSHWPGRRCPSRASPRPTGWEVKGSVVVGSVTELTGDHGEGCGEDDEGGSSLQEHRRSSKGELEIKEKISEKEFELKGPVFRITLTVS